VHYTPVGLSTLPQPPLHSGDLDILPGTDILAISGHLPFYYVILAFDPFTLKTCNILAMTQSKYVPIFGENKQSAAELKRFKD